MSASHSGRPLIGRDEPFTFCPGYLRGLSFVGGYAVVGLSQCRENRTFQGLELDDNLKSHDAEAHRGLCVIDLRTGDLVDWLWLQGVVRELYDVVVLPALRRASALGFKSDEIRRTIIIGPRWRNQCGEYTRMESPLMAAIEAKQCGSRSSPADQQLMKASLRRSSS